MSNDLRTIGRLMTEEEFRLLGKGLSYTRVYRDNNSGDIIAYLKPLSMLPTYLANTKAVLCNVKYLDENLLALSLSDVEKTLANQVMAFRADKVSVNVYAFEQNYIKDPLKIANKHSSFMPVPYFELDELGISITDFESMLLKGEEIKFAPIVSDNVQERPSIILVKVSIESRNEYLTYSGFNEFRVNRDSVRIQIDRVEDNKKIFEDGLSIITDEPDGIVFIPKDVVAKYVTNEASAPKVEPVASNSVVEEKLTQVHTEDKDKKGSLTIIDEMQRISESMGLIYGKEDLINFYISAEASNFIVLAGMSGTGKSKLVKVYAKALGADKYDGIKFISVSPAWTDDSDILGYVDYRNMLYREADTELVAFLKRAADDKDNKYIVCFDEMNLARVEHYFSQFLSILEDKPEERNLTVYNKSLEGKLYNSTTYPASVRIWDNVLFVGTVNIDESTINFSDKVLDRVNVIKLGMRPFTELKSVIKDCVLTDQELECLTEFHKMIRDLNPKLGIGYRIVKQINSYIKNIPVGAEYTRAVAFDKLLVQRIITKLRGSEEQLIKLVGKLDKEGNLIASDVVVLLDKYKEVSDFNFVKKELKNKAKELMLYGYSI